ARQRNGEVDHLVAQWGADFERRRQRIGLRHGERRAVGEDTPRPPQRELADREQVALDLQLHESPGIRTQRANAALYVVLEVALLLLKMLRAQEQPFGPDNSILLGHLGLHLRSALLQRVSR